MDGFGIYIHKEGRGQSRYSNNGDIEQTFDLAEAEHIGYELLQERDLTYVTLIAGDPRDGHELQMWGRGHEDADRWTDWYVDVEIHEHRWIFMPGDSIDSWNDANEVAEKAATHAEVTRIWIGKSDGSSTEVIDNTNR